MDLLDLSRVILDTSTITVDVEFVIGIAIVEGNIQDGEDPRFISCNNVHIVIKCIKCTFERVLLRINKETLVHR